VHQERLQVVNHNTISTSETTVEEQEIRPICSSSYLYMDNDETLESFNIETEGIFIHSSATRGGGDKWAIAHFILIFAH
jgi:hypothetical protein